MLTIGQSVFIVVIAIIVIGLALPLSNERCGFAKSVMLTFGGMLLVCVAYNYWKFLLTIIIIAVLYVVIRIVGTFYKKSAHKKKIVVTTLVVLILSGAISVMAYILHTNYVNNRQQKNTETFLSAIACAESHSYTDALELLELLPSDFVFDSFDNYDVYKLRTYIKAQMKYEPDDLDILKSIKEDLEHFYPSSFSAVSNVLSDEMKQFVEQVNKRYDTVKRESLMGVVPYEGMSEEDLLYTDWGKPYKIEKYYDWDHVLWYRRHKNYYYEILIDGKYTWCDVLVLYDDNGNGTVHSVYLSTPK